MQTVEHVTALIACHVFSVTDRPGKGPSYPLFSDVKYVAIVLCVNHFYWLTNALNCIKLKG